MQSCRVHDVQTAETGSTLLLSIEPYTLLQHAGRAILYFVIFFVIFCFYDDGRAAAYCICSFGSPASPARA